MYFPTTKNALFEASGSVRHKTFFATGSSATSDEHLPPAPREYDWHASLK